MLDLEYRRKHYYLNSIYLQYIKGFALICKLFFTLNSLKVS